MTQGRSWRWSLYANLLVAVPASIAALRLVPDLRNPYRPKIDVAGVLSVTGGLFALVFGFANAETHSWSAPLTIISIACSAVLLVVFVGIEIRTAEPLLPLDIVRDRARGGAYAAMALAGASVFSLSLFLTLLQNDLRFSPLLTGVSFLPFTASVIFAATINQTRLLPRIGARPVVFGGSVLGLAAMLLLTRLSPQASYSADVLPSLILPASASAASSPPPFRPGRSESGRHMPGSHRRSSTCPNKWGARSVPPPSAPSSPVL